MSWTPPAEEQAKVAEFVKLFGEQPQKTKHLSSRPVQSSKGGIKKRLHSFKSPLNVVPKKSLREEVPSKQLTTPLSNQRQLGQIDSEDEDRALEAIKRKRAEIA